MTVAERREVIKDKGFCFNCLCTAHTRNFCPSRRICVVCERNHHTMIHVDEPVPKRKPKTKPPRQASNQHRPHRSPSADSHRSQVSHSPDRPTVSSRRRGTAVRNPTSSKLRPKPTLNERLSRRSRTHVFSLRFRQ